MCVGKPLPGVWGAEGLKLKEPSKKLKELSKK